MGHVMLKVENISKEYRLGQIGRTTLRDELQRRSAKLHHREDPTRKIGAAEHAPGETFLALDHVSFEVEKGERVGIIGRNGAGKSTLLKLISRITAPTTGDIWLDGRVASMLEVGTGFNRELTGRENIYMNGAILGMRKREIDAKIEDIIEFSECRQFIDTPVKRYSSGMYVKLAFSVAAYLDAEIMIMDEVLAVGDLAFRKKCLEKMEEVSRAGGRTVLFVSHNMNTIRQFCDRCMVLEGGRIIFDGDVEEAIHLYVGPELGAERLVNLRNMQRTPDFVPHAAAMSEMECLGTDSNVFPMGAVIDLRMACTAEAETENVQLRIIIKDMERRAVTMMTTTKGFRLGPSAETQLYFTLDTSRLAPGRYTVNPVVYLVNQHGEDRRLDGLNDIWSFEITQPRGFNLNMAWKQRRWGYFYNSPIEMREESLG